MRPFLFTNSGKCYGLLIIFFLQPFFASSQTFELAKADITVRGIAREKPWSMTTSTAEGITDLIIRDGKLTGVQLLNFSINVTDLKSGNVRMDQRAYKALKSYPYDRVQFSGKFMNVTQIGPKSYILLTDGNLYIGGITQIASLTVQIDLNEDGTLSCSGTKEIKLSDFNVGLRPMEQNVMRLGDSVQINFQLVLNRTSGNR